MKKNINKILFAILSLFLLLSCVTIMATAAETVSIAGDVNCDGELTSNDARLILRASVGLEKLDYQWDIADMDGDDRISASDARLCIRAAVGLESFLPVVTDIPIIKSTANYLPCDDEITAEYKYEDDIHTLEIKINDWPSFCCGDFVLKYDDSISVTNIAMPYLYNSVSAYNDSDGIRFSYAISDNAQSSEESAALLTVTFNKASDTEKPEFTLTGKAKFSYERYVSVDTKIVAEVAPGCLLSFEPEVPASCGVTGTKEHYSCSHCDKLYLDSNAYTSTTADDLVIPALTHKYIKIPTLPTCSTKGYTTNVCINCNDYFIDNEVSENGHKLGEYKPYFPATCTSVGENRADCENCDYYEIERTPVAPHNFTETIYVPTCVSEGFTLYYCADCNMTYLNNFVPMLAHEDFEGDGLCDYCATEVENVDDDLPVCDHICHKTGFFGFIWQIINFFQKLFRINPVCECGAAHY